jgi:hypothetical protein
MIFRLSQKLSTKIKVGSLGLLPLDENPFADWSGHLFSADRTQYIIVCNTKSLYATVMYAKGIVDDNRFIVRALGGIRKFLEDDGQPFTYQRYVVPISGSVRFAKALDRSVTGSLNDMIHLAKIYLIDDQMAPHDVGLRLNETPFSVLAYANPRETFKAMLAPPVGESRVEQ